MIISIDGLPGVGKTTFIHRLGERYNIPILPELTLPNLAREDYDESSFIENDIYKIQTAKSLNDVVLDRSFCSTVTFKMAQSGDISKDSFYNIKYEYYKDIQIKPDLMIIVMSPPPLALFGLKMRGDIDIFNYSFLKKWWQSFNIAATLLSNDGVSVRCIPSKRTYLFRSLINNEFKL